MRIGVVGASGNAGTGLLRHLEHDLEVTVEVAVARRVPAGRPPAPYAGASGRPRWLACDIGADAPDDAVVAPLAEAFRGLDAVVHLAWQMQPSHDRARLRATNVDGSRRVAEAVVAAGVPHLVVASSVGAYSPVADDDPRDESWATEGVRSSSYSVDKVALERLLDEVEDRVAVARVRPALVFQRDAGSSIERYFLGPGAPAWLVGALPVLPWPAGFRVQAVHADDLAAVYRAVVVARATGAFNVAADDVLRRADVADVLTDGRAVDVPVPLVRSAVAAAWRARALHLSPGWIDLAAGIPLLDTTRVRTKLGWRPRVTAQQALAEVVEGMVAGSGTASPPLRARGRARPSLLGGQSAEW
ncbi:NAD-dependent epimerase/dehydratase family protein [Actinotalea sp. AC32]|nr:NAD-dependent epimerase/dehydratase family protein [Actinotalea sp. AC32]